MLRLRTRNKTEINILTECSEYNILQSICEILREVIPLMIDGDLYEHRTIVIKLLVLATTAPQS